MHCAERAGPDGHLSAGSRRQENRDNMNPRIWIFIALLGSGALLPASAYAKEKVAVVISQAVGVGPLADHLGNLAAEHLGKGVARVIGPGESARLLREKGGPAPESCGSDAGCLRQIARALEAQWVVAIGVGSFGEIFSLELRCVEQEEAEEAATTSATYAAPGPDWGQALRERLGAIVPKRLLHSRGELLVHSGEVGAEIRVNDLAAGTIPLAQPLRLPEGKYTVELRHEGHASTQQTVEIRAGEITELELGLLPMGGRPPLRTYAYLTSGTAVAALGVAVGLHLSASSTMDDARELQRQGKPFADDRSAALGRVGTARIFYGVAGAAAVASAILFYLDHQQAAP